MSQYTPPVGNGNNGYMDWGGGSSNQTRSAANKIDNTAGKVQLIAEMLETALLGFDAIEKELVIIANAPHPPQSHSLHSIAVRVDTNQKQVQMGLEKIKALMSEIDRTTNSIQRPNNTW